MFASQVSAITMRFHLQRPTCGWSRPLTQTNNKRPWKVAVPPQTSFNSTTSNSTSLALAVDEEELECDVVLIGSGIAGLSCAALLARYGLSVIVCESHSILGGAAHAFTRRGYHFESGPSLYSGMNARGPAANPLSLVLQAIGEDLGLIKYDIWNVLVPEVPEGVPTGVGPTGFDELLEKARGKEALVEWRRLMDKVKPLADAATALPPLSIRLDPNVIQSAVFRYFGSMLKNITTLPTLTAPFAAVLDSAQIKDQFIRNYIDLLCFLLSGLPADATITAEVAFMMKEWFSDDARLEFPVGGSQAMVEALVRGVTKRGGKVFTNAHVEEILMEKEKAVGVRVRATGDKKLTIRSTKAVVSNASTPDTLKLLPTHAIPMSWKQEVDKTPLNPSFMHLHLGFDATGLENQLSSPLEMHHMVVRSWEGGVTSPHNVVLISIPSVEDPSLAPEGKHCLHAYYPATEPWEPWQNLVPGSKEYESFKLERSKALYEAVERVIPGIKSRIEIEMIGSPLTHARFLRRWKGTYGPSYRAGQQVFPFGGGSQIEKLYCCGDFAFPGIGLPAVAASGAIVANSLVSLKEHVELLESIGL